MYDSKKARIEEMRVRFDREMESRSAQRTEVAEQYLESLDDFVNTINDGAGGDPRLLGLDTTGQLARNEEEAAWAEEERRRVRRRLAESG